MTVEPGARTALVGRNGEGKSTLLKMLAGIHQPDTGEIIVKSGLKVAYLPQSVPVDFTGPTYDVVAGGLDSIGAVLAEFNSESQRLGQGETHTPDGKKSLIDRLAQLQDKIDAQDGWAMIQQVEQTLSRMQLDADTLVESFRAALSAASFWLAHWCLILMFCYSTSPPTIWISVPSLGWKTT